MIDATSLLNAPSRLEPPQGPALAVANSASVTPEDGPEFGKMILDLAAGAVDVVRTAETTSVAAVLGQASVQQAVEAVMTAEQTLQATMAIRDKAVQAYLELSRMAI